ncbi:LOW QUALITY PROTEIN: hypothetical protein ACHAW5_005724 [Stephanodiscus triporus]|uniref:Uncharacterized protein n=1 Tax=Stephanodiscus triporus TaxID=2934178 RepID=A0ABD3NR56_9STRA
MGTDMQASMEQEPTRVMRMSSPDLAGSMNPDYCVMLSLSVFLEAWISQGQGRISQWLFSDGVTSASSADEQETHHWKSRLYSCISSIVKKMSLSWIRPHRPIEPWPIIPPRSMQRHMRGGEESFRTSSTSGHVGRQRNPPKIRTPILFSLARHQGSFGSMPWRNITKIKSGVNISDNWLSNHVCPGISSCFGRGLLLSLQSHCFGLQWMKYDGLRLHNMNSLAEDAEHLQVQTNVNPVEKVTVLVAEVDGVPEFSEVDPEFLGTSNTGLGGGGGGGGPLMMEWRNFVTAKICGMENRMHDLQSNQGGHHGELVK